MIDFLKLLPNLLQNDDFSYNLSLILNKYLNEIDDVYNNLFLMKNLDKLNEKILDEIARDRSIVWYDSLLPAERKRDIIKNYRLVYRTLGSEKAVLQLIKDYFGSSGSILNWYDYNSTHHRFKIKINNLQLEISYLYRFLDSLKYVKSLDTWLDEMIINRTININKMLGIAVNSTKDIKINISPKKGGLVKSSFFVHPATNRIKNIKINVKPNKSKGVINSDIGVATNRIKNTRTEIKPNLGAKYTISLSISINRQKYIKINVKEGKDIG